MCDGCDLGNNLTRIPFAGDITKDIFRVSSRPLIPPSILVMRYLLSTVDKMVLASIVANTWPTHILRPIPVYGIRWYNYVGSCWNNMAESKISFFDWLSEMQWKWRDQSYSLFENLKNNRIDSDIIQLVGERYVWIVSCCICKDSESLIGMNVLRNEIPVWARLSDFERVLQAWRMCSKERILSHMWGEAKSVLQTVFGGNANGVVFKLLLSYYFEIGRVNQTMSIEYKDPSEEVFCELFMGIFKIDLYIYNVHCKTLRVWSRRYLIWEV